MCASKLHCQSIWARKTYSDVSYNVIRRCFVMSPAASYKYIKLYGFVWVHLTANLGIKFGGYIRGAAKSHTYTK